jgi:hypothetical protein
VFDGNCPILIVPRHIGMASIKIEIFQYSTYSNRYMSNRYSYLLASQQVAAYTCCCMYCLELLMMDVKDVRNMYSVIPK